MEDYKLIPLTQGKFAIVDPEDYDLLSHLKWYFAGGYAKSNKPSKEGGQKVLMHRHILDAPGKMEVDHINGNRLDNRRCNLRLCTSAQNRCNQRTLRKKKTSKYKGVFWNDFTNNWGACIRTKVLGRFSTEEEAARYYDAAARFYFKDFAATNFPGDEALSIEQIRQISWEQTKSKSASRFLGVRLEKRTGRWVAATKHRRVPVHIGTFDTEEEAAIARDQKVKELGIKTRLNFPD